MNTELKKFYTVYKVIDAPHSDLHSMMVWQESFEKRENAIHYMLDWSGTEILKMTETWEIIDTE